MRTSLAAQKVSGAAAGALVALRTGGARDVRVFEVGVFVGSAVAGTVGLGRPAAQGVTPTVLTGPTAQANSHDSASLVGTTVIDGTWATAPTAPATYWRRAALPATIGAGVIWTFPLGITIPTSSSIVIHQISTAAVTYEVYFEFDE